MTEIYISSFTGLAKGNLGNIPMALMPGLRTQKETVPTDATIVKYVLNNDENILRVVSLVDCLIYFKGWKEGGSDTDADAKTSVGLWLISNATEYITIPKRIKYYDESFPWYNRAIYIKKDF